MKRRYLLTVLFLLFFPACGLLVDEGRQVIAKVGKEPVRLDELLVRIRALPFEQRARTNDSDPSVRLQIRRALLDAIIVEKLLVQEAKTRRIEVSDEEVELKLIEREEAQGHESPEAVEGMGGAGSHEHKDGEQEHSKREINEMRLQLMVQKMVDSELDEAARRRYYDGHPEEFSLPSPHVVYELLIMDSAHRENMQKISETAAKEGKTLVQALSSFENAPPALFCGELPPTPSNRLVPAVKEKVERLSAGQVSEPFHINPESEKQLAVARLVRYINTIPFERVRGAIHKKLYDNFMQELQRKYKVVYYQERLDYRLDG
jgi:hypothetical protein